MRQEKIRHTTLEIYLIHIELRILPAFKYLKMDQIRPKHIIDFLSNLSEDGMRADGKKGKLAGSTIAYVYRILLNIFNFAVELKLFEESPMQGVKKPDDTNVEVYTLEEVVQLLQCLKKETHVPHWQIAIQLAITLGLRRSELLALDLLKDFDFENRIVKIRKALTYSKSEGLQLHEIRKGNKVAKKRDLVFSEFLVDPLKKLVLTRKKEMLARSDPWGDGTHCFLLSDENGKPFNPYSVQNWWRRFIKRHNLKYVNIHALRHTSATLLIERGVHAKTISERLGHSGIETTMNIYGHALRQADKLATSKLDDVLYRVN